MGQTTFGIMSVRNSIINVSFRTLCWEGNEHLSTRAKPVDGDETTRVKVKMRMDHGPGHVSIRDNPSHVPSHLVRKEKSRYWYPVLYYRKLILSSGKGHPSSVTTLPSLLLVTFHPGRASCKITITLTPKSTIYIKTLNKEGPRLVRMQIQTSHIRDGTNTRRLNMK